MVLIIFGVGYLGAASTEAGCGVLGQPPLDPFNSYFKEVFALLTLTNTRTGSFLESSSREARSGGTSSSVRGLPVAGGPGAFCHVEAECLDPGHNHATTRFRRGLSLGPSISGGDPGRSYVSNIGDHLWAQLSTNFGVEQSTTDAASQCLHDPGAGFGRGQDKSGDHESSQCYNLRCPQFVLWGCDRGGRRSWVLPGPVSERDPWRSRLLARSFGG